MPQSCDGEPFLVSPLANPRQRIVLELIERALPAESCVKDDLRRAVGNLTDQRGAWSHLAQRDQGGVGCLRRDNGDDAAFTGQIQRIKAKQLADRLHRVVDGDLSLG